MIREIDWEIVLMSLAITIIAYTLCPLTLRFLFSKKYNEKKAKKIAIINSVVVYIIFSLIHIFILDDNKIANIAPALIWGSLGFYIIRDKNLVDESLNSQENLNQNSTIKDKKNTSFKDLTISELVERSNLSKTICTDIYEILIHFKQSKRENAFNKIHTSLVIDLKKEGKIGEVGIAFGMLIDKIALTKEEANYYSTKVIEEMLNTKDKML